MRRICVLATAMAMCPPLVAVEHVMLLDAQLAVLQNKASDPLDMLIQRGLESFMGAYGGRGGGDPESDWDAYQKSWQTLPVAEGVIRRAGPGASCWTISKGSYEEAMQRFQDSFITSDVDPGFKKWFDTTFHQRIATDVVQAMLNFLSHAARAGVDPADHRVKSSVVDLKCMVRAALEIDGASIIGHAQEALRRLLDKSKVRWVELELKGGRGQKVERLQLLDGVDVLTAQVRADLFYLLLLSALPAFTTYMGPYPREWELSPRALWLERVFGSDQGRAILLDPLMPADEGRREVIRAFAMREVINIAFDAYRTAMVQALKAKRAQSKLQAQADVPVLAAIAKTAQYLSGRGGLYRPESCDEEGLKQARSAIQIYFDEDHYLKPSTDKIYRDGAQFVAKMHEYFYQLLACAGYAKENAKAESAKQEALEFLKHYMPFDMNSELLRKERGIDLDQFWKLLGDSEALQGAIKAIDPGKVVPPELVLCFVFGIIPADLREAWWKLHGFTAERRYGSQIRNWAESFTGEYVYNF